MKKKNWCYILFLLLIIYYFEYSVTILWDSAHYMNYVNILERIAPINTWDVVRGPIFPLIIYLGNILFGKTSQGLLMNTFMYYLVMLFFVYKILNYFFNNWDIDAKKKKLLMILTFAMIIFNPIIFGFYHSLLTEFVAITLSVMSCYYAVIWYDVEPLKDKKKFVLISLWFAFLTVFSWFLKQPYISCGIFPLLVSYVISLFKKGGFKVFLCRTSSILLCLLTLFVSIKLWNYVLLKMGNDPNSDRNPTVSFGYTLINGLGIVKANSGEEVKNIDYVNEIKLSDKEKKEVLSLIDNNKDYVIINIYDNNKITESDYIEGNLSTGDAITYIVKYFFKEPLTIIDAYISNYLAIIDIYSTSTSDSIGYSINKKVDLSFSSEISSIAFKPYYYGSSNIFYMLPEMEERVNCYRQTNYTFKPINYAMLILGKVFLGLFKLLFALLPLNFLVAIVLRCKKNTKINQKRNLNFIIILLGFSFLHVLLHAATGAVIDRYAIPSFVTVILGTIFLLLYLFQLKFKKAK